MEISSETKSFKLPSLTLQSKTISMSPPSYFDLGKEARDVFGKGYHWGQVKLDVKTRHPMSGTQLSSGGVTNTDSGKVTANIEVKTKRCPGTGTQLTTKWTTDNVLNTTVDVQDKLMSGLKLTLDTQLNPDTGSKNGKLKAELKTAAALLSLDTDLNLSGPIVNTAAVLGHKGWLAGLQCVYDASKSKLVKNNLSLGYSKGDFVLHSNINDGAIFGASVYQKVQSNIETGVNLGWTASSNTTSFGVGLKYNLEQGGCLRAKINNSSQIGLGYQQSIRPGVSLSLSTLIDGKNFNQGGHKVGLALELES